MKDDRIHTEALRYVVDNLPPEYNLNIKIVDRLVKSYFKYIKKIMSFKHNYDIRNLPSSYVLPGLGFFKFNYRYAYFKMFRLKNNNRPYKYQLLKELRALRWFLYKVDEQGFLFVNDLNGESINVPVNIVGSFADAYDIFYMMLREMKKIDSNLVICDYGKDLYYEYKVRSKYRENNREYLKGNWELKVNTIKYYFSSGGDLAAFIHNQCGVAESEIKKLLKRGRGGYRSYVFKRVVGEIDDLQEWGYKT